MRVFCTNLLTTNNVKNKLQARRVVKHYLRKTQRL